MGQQHSSSRDGSDRSVSSPLQIYPDLRPVSNTSLPLSDFSELLFFRVPDPMPYPCCWDELLDLCQTASDLQSRVSFAYSLASEDRLKFVPLLLRSDSKSRINALQSLSWFEKANFFAESVVVVLQLQQRDASTVLSILPVEDLLRLFSLLCKLSDLLSLYPCEIKKTGKNGHSNTNTTTLSECTICYNRVENSVLSCSHSLCRECETEWVCTHLVCPFCRKRFSNVRDVRRSGWELTKWSQTDLEDDIVDLKCKLESIWMRIFETRLSDKEISPVLEFYTEVSRSLEMMDDPSGFVVISNQA